MLWINVKVCMYLVCILGKLGKLNHYSNRAMRRTRELGQWLGGVGIYLFSQHIQTGSGNQPAYHIMDNMCSVPMGRAACPWNCPVTSIKIWGKNTWSSNPPPPPHTSKWHDTTRNTGTNELKLSILYMGSTCKSLPVLPFTAAKDLLYFFEHFTFGIRYVCYLLVSDVKFEVCCLIKF